MNSSASNMIKPSAASAPLKRAGNPQVSTSSKKDKRDTFFCTLCDKNIPKTYYKNHLRSAAHTTADSGNSDNGTIIQISQAFASRIATYRIMNDSSKSTIQEFLVDRRECFEELVGPLVIKFTAVKVNVELCALFVKYNLNNDAESTTDQKSFNTKNVLITFSDDVSEIYKNFCETLIKKSEEFEERDSGWAFQQVLHLQVNINKYTPFQGGSYIPLPKDVQSKRACINVKNRKDNACIAWAIVSALRPVEIHPERLSSYPHYSKVLNVEGSICGGHCCSNKTENELLKLATNDFESMLHHHTRSLRGILETTSDTFRNHVIDLLNQSEEKTLNVFSRVYRRMLPSSKELIGNLYAHIRSYFTATSDSEPDQHIRTFFFNLFPIAYHQAVHLNNGDLQAFYIDCLKKSYDDLNPFGDVPKDLSKTLTQNLDAGRLFIDVLKKASEVLDEADKLDSMALIEACRTHLLKMTYCRQCHGHTSSNIKPCHGYCKNVMRGCLSQFLGVLDNPWSNVGQAIETFVTTSILSDTGVFNGIKALDTKLSEAIMRAMENGPELEKKIKKACGSPDLLPAKNLASEEVRPTQNFAVKPSTPPDQLFINFLSTIEKSRYFYSKTGDNLCDEGDYQRNDQNCWTGDNIGEYTHHVSPTGLDRQKYNPEIPLITQHSYPQGGTLNTLVDKLIKLRSTIVNTLPSNTRSYSDIQSDMARHDEEGSGARVDDFDDEDTAGSGSGSGELTPQTFDSPIKPTTPSSRSESTGASSSLSSFVSLLQILVVYSIASFLSH